MPLSSAFGTGFQSGSQSVAQGLALKQKSQEQEEQKRIQRLKEHEDRKAKFADVLDKYVKGVYASDPENAAQKVEQFKLSKDVNSQIKMFTTIDQALGQNPNSTTMMFSNVLDQPSPTDLARQEGKVKGVTEAEKAKTTVSEIEGGKGDVEKLLGIEKPSSSEFLQLVEARDNASGENKEMIQARINKLTSQGSGDPSVQKNIVLPIITKALNEGVDSLSENQWDALALASRTKGVDLLIEQQVRSLLKMKDIDPSISEAFENDKGLPKGSVMGKQKANGAYEVIKDNKIIGEWKAP